jgi:acyl carrier protein
MSREEILEKLKEIAVKMDDRFADSVSDITEEKELLRDLGFSSMQMLFLAVMLEETFHIKLGQPDYLHLVTVGDVIDLVERLSSGSRADSAVSS